MIMGVSFAYVPSMQAIAGHESGLGVPMILGAQIVGGIVAIIVGFSIKKIRKLFPPLIAGTVVFTIGLSLYPTAVNYMAGGAGKPLASEIGKLGFGSWQNWTTALITLAVVTVLNHYTKGILKLASILIGVIVGYVVALGFGLVDFSGVASAGLFQFPTPLYLTHLPALPSVFYLPSTRSRQSVTFPQPPPAPWTVCRRTRSFREVLWVTVSPIS